MLHWGGDTAEQKEKKKVPRKCPRVCGGEQRGETRTMAYNELFRSQDPNYLIAFSPFNFYSLFFSRLLLLSSFPRQIDLWGSCHVCNVALNIFRTEGEWDGALA